MPETLVVRSAATSDEEPRLAGRLVTGGSRFHVLRLPTGHRHLILTSDPPGDDPLRIVLEADLAASVAGAEHRLLFLEAPRDGTPRVHAFSGLSRQNFGEFLDKKLGELGRVGVPPTSIVWGLRYLVHRPLGPDGESVRPLTILPAQVAYPDDHADPLIEVASLLDTRARGLNGSVPSLDPDKPMIVQSLERDGRYRKRPGLRLRMVSSDPRVRWVQQRCAVVHVRHQIRAVERHEVPRLEQHDAVSSPFDDHDIVLIGRTPDRPEERERLSLAVPAGGPTLRAGSLVDFVEGAAGAPAAFPGVEAAGKSAREGASGDGTTLWFDHLALGDDFGIVSTQPGALRIRVPDGGAAVSQIALFRVTLSGLQPVSVSEAEEQDLVDAAASVQANDTFDRADDTGASERAKSRRAFAEWCKGRLGESIPLTFRGTEPLGILAALDQVRAARSPGPDGALRALGAMRRDPALAALLIEDRLSRDDVATRVPDGPGDATLLGRYAAACDVAGAIAPEGIVPATEMEALAVLRDLQLRDQLKNARIALDGGPSDLRAHLGVALANLGNKGVLQALAKSIVPAHRDEAKRVEAYLSRLGRGEWISLGEAFDLAQRVSIWSSKRSAIDAIIAELPPRPSDRPIATDRSREPNDIRQAITRLYNQVPEELRSQLLRIDLDELDVPQLVQLEGKLLVLIHGPVRERLIDELLEALETWMDEPEFFHRMAQSGRQGDADRAAPLRRRDGAAQFMKRVETFQDWPQPGQEDDPFTHKRRALRNALEARSRSHLGQDDKPDEDFRRLVLDVADQCLHARAWRALKVLAKTVHARHDPNGDRRGPGRAMVRGLSHWPDDAAATWAAGLTLATTLGQRQHLEQALALPGFQTGS